MSVSKQEILATLAAIEAQAPLHFGDLRVADEKVRDIYASAMAGMSNSPEFQCATAACKEVTLLAVLTHALLEATQWRQLLSAAGESAAGETQNLLLRVGS